MSLSKWIGAAIGWSFGGPIGAILGMALGGIFDGAIDGKSQPKIGKSSRASQSKRPRHTEQKSRTQSGDFEVSLLILASIVIKADGKQDQRELDFVRQQFLNMYGKERANQAFDLFMNRNTCLTLVFNMKIDVCEVSKGLLSIK